MVVNLQQLHCNKSIVGLYLLWLKSIVQVYTSFYTMLLTSNLILRSGSGPTSNWSWFDRWPRGTQEAGPVCNLTAPVRWSANKTNFNGMLLVERACYVPSCGVKTSTHIFSFVPYLFWWFILERSLSQTPHLVHEDSEAPHVSRCGVLPVVQSLQSWNKSDDT